MIEITERITSVTTSSDAIAPPRAGNSGRSQIAAAARAATGARVTLEFCRSVPLPPDCAVSVRYDFAGDGRLRECTGIARPTHTVARPGRLVVFHYRLSHWIAPAAVMHYAAHNVRCRTEERDIPPQHSPHMRNAVAVFDGNHDQLIAIVAHELRYPLVPIRNAAALLKDGDLDPATVQRAAEIIERQVQDMNGLIGDLVDVSRVQLGALELRPTRGLLSELMDHLLESARPYAIERGHVLSVSVSAEAVYLQMDQPRLCRALHNLIANACKYTDKHGQIQVFAQREGANVIIVVKDTGIGIATAPLESIFGLFTQGGQGGRIEAGLDLGLYLARHFVEAHGGTLTAASAGLNRGSEFTIRLPCEVPTAATGVTTGGEPAADPIRA